jgi:hypothetical protein
MALHRDIFWIGRQWAVTGHGMQLIDQRLEGAFDIEVIRLWDDDLMASLRAKAWLKAEDFDKALAVARTRHPQASSTSVAAPPVPAIEPIAPPPPKLERPATLNQAASPQPLPIEPPKQHSPELQMKIDGGASFARPWRVWMKKT